MTSFYNAAATTTAILLLSAGIASAATPANPASEEIFQEVDHLAFRVSDTASDLNTLTRNPAAAEDQGYRLNDMKRTINRIGADLRALEADRSSLTPWQAQTLDKAEPLMAKVAANAEKAIHGFNTGRSHLWATSFATDTASIFNEAGQVGVLMRDSVKLAKDRTEEGRLERQLGGTPTY